MKRLEDDVPQHEEVREIAVHLGVVHRVMRGRDQHLHDPSPAWEDLVAEVLEHVPQHREGNERELRLDVHRDELYREGGGSDHEYLADRVRAPHPEPNESVTMVELVGAPQIPMVERSDA